MTKVFISSVIKGFEKFRQAAKEAVETVGMIPIMSENFNARPYSPQKACIKEVQESELVVLILGERRGHEESGVSATEAEYLAANKANIHILPFVQVDVTMEEKQKQFKQRIEHYSEGFCRAGFPTPKILKERIISSLNDWKSSPTSVNCNEIKKKMQARCPQHPPNRGGAVSGNNGGYLFPWAVVAFWGQPEQSLYLEQKDIEDEFKKLLEINASFSGDYNSSRNQNYQSVSYPKDAPRGEEKYSDVRYYSDGLILFHFTPRTETHYRGAVNYILPEEFANIVKAAYILNRANSSCVFLKIFNSNMYFGKPSTAGSRTLLADRVIVEEFDPLFPVWKGRYVNFVEKWIEKIRMGIRSR